jgi:hypothetical protein
VELRQNGAPLFAFVIAETVTHGRIRVLGIAPDRALAIARQINHTVVELATVNP